MVKVAYLPVVAILTAGVIFLAGCSKKSTETELVGGNPTHMGEVGNTFSGSVAGMTDFSAIIQNNSRNISTIHCPGVVTDPVMLGLVGSVNSGSLASINTATGEFTMDLRVRFTDEGIVDYFASDGSGSVLVNYNAGVGTKYTCRNAEGKTFTREVTAKSTTDDYTWGFLKIKVSTIEEKPAVRGIQKVVYRANHQYGLVNISVCLDDGTIYSFPVFSTKTN